MSALLEVARPGAASRQHPLGARTWVGSAERANVRVEAPGLCPRHFVIVLGPRAVEVRLARGAAPLTRQGEPFRGGRLAYGEDFYFGALRFNCWAPRRSRARLALVAGVLVAALPIVVAAGFPRAAEPSPARRAAPLALAPFAVLPQCPHGDPTRAERDGRRLEAAARAKRERYRFEPYDGVMAGRWYAQAEDCFARANAPEPQARMAAEGSAWREQVTSDLRAAALRLEAALGSGEHGRALEEIRALLRVTRNEPSPYASWLARKERELSREPPRR